jgi:hypothetical protein
VGGCGTITRRGATDAGQSVPARDLPVRRRHRRSSVRQVTGLLADVGITLVRIVLNFYGFWLIWRILLPWLPGPADVHERVAPYVCYFTDPFVIPTARRLRLGERVVAAAALIIVAAALVGLDLLAKQF